MAKKLRPKYLVSRIDEETGIAHVMSGLKSTDPEDINSPFVLMPRKDPAALLAMATYANVCEPDLAQEIREFLHKIVESPGVLGTQGERNLRAFLKSSINE